MEQHSERSSRRTGYACDGCKRQKVKCSGGQPCQRCTQNGITCAYGSSVGRSAAPYIKFLEDQIADLKASVGQQTQQSIASDDEESPADTNRRGAAVESLLDTLVGPEDDYFVVADGTRVSLYHGSFGGLSILRAVRDLCSHQQRSIGHPLVDKPGVKMVEALDSPDFEIPARTRTAELAFLPSLPRLTDTITVALDRALTCKECVDREELWPQIHSLYARDPEDFTLADRSLLGLVYALLALGRRYEQAEMEQWERRSSGPVLPKGLHYFVASRTIILSEEYADLNSITALCCLASYLLSTFMISKAYDLICKGVSAALRMGLHVSNSTIDTRLPKDELIRRRRVFATLNILAVITASMLGLPNLLTDADQGQLLPLAEDDLADDGQHYIESHPSSPISATVCSARLFRILAQITESRTIPRKTTLVSSSAYGLEGEMISKCEAELEKWHESLSHMLSAPQDRQVLRSKVLLRLQHAAVQITLYRPFLHHIRNVNPSLNPDDQARTYGYSCLRASCRMVRIIETMNQHGFLHAAQWYAIYHLALAASSLMLFVISNTGDEQRAVDESRNAANKAIGLLRTLGETSVSARHCYESLEALSNDREGIESLGMSPRTYFFTAIGAGDPEMTSS